LEGKKKGRTVWIQVCPECLSPRIQRLGALTGDMIGSIGWLPWKYKCSDCGWLGRFVIEKETSLPTKQSNENE
jgi:hypothetical protein